MTCRYFDNWFNFIINEKKKHRIVSFFVILAQIQKDVR